eukprot:354321-Chlamydomonas_euryale.AAC.6
MQEAYNSEGKAAAHTRRHTEQETETSEGGREVDKHASFQDCTCILTLRGAGDHGGAAADGGRHATRQRRPRRDAVAATAAAACQRAGHLRGGPAHASGRGGLGRGERHLVVNLSTRTKEKGREGESARDRERRGECGLRQKGR